ncbi:protein IQ-DOMAIN 1 [Neltuma alba]|uniref:protein IQ-DOMAIN 1 n=1 Tax=Neltuma alba TaxID=207710 RepID=UPI0010A5172F|nr:protein IQ-DOMAIN 1-like [Prosopis alba]XP_028780291.1 protein IQ-DOMAIN 1-like [Prosopis alba]
MGSGDWFKTIISLRKSKEGNSKKAKGSPASKKQTALKLKNYAGKNSSNLTNGGKGSNLVSPGVSVETIAATMIQTAFRAYLARKSLRRLKGCAKLKVQIQGHSVKDQAGSAVSYIHKWSKIQAEIRARRICMVTEDRIRRKKLESQLKLEAKLHGLEVEWSGGSETMEETLARIHHREEAAVKRERAMAYAFSHQWRANSNQGLGNYELNKANWGWSWKDRWIAARPWESRVLEKPVNHRKAQTRQPKKLQKVQKDKNPSTPKTPVPVKPPVANAKVTSKVTPKARRLSYPATEKNVLHEESNKS